MTVTSVTSGENTKSQIKIMLPQSRLGPTHIPLAWDAVRAVC